MMQQDEERITDKSARVTEKPDSLLGANPPGDKSVENPVENPVENAGEKPEQKLVGKSGENPGGPGAAYRAVLTLALKRESACKPLARLLADRLRAGDVLALAGDLGSGKTVFARALIRLMADAPSLDVPSPTFTLVQPYDTPLPVTHADLYRLSAGESLDDLLLEEALDDGVLVVEWPDRLPARLLDKALLLRFEDQGGDGRRVTLYAPFCWQMRLLGPDLYALSGDTRTASVMILAAGNGTRMKDARRSEPLPPKPLTPVAGKALIDYVLDRLTAHLPAVVNIHHLADQMLAHLDERLSRRALLISAEEELLETGGGVVRALPLLTPDSFTVINADVIRVDAVGRREKGGLLDRLRAAFDPARMDVLLALAPMDRVTGWHRRGDIVLLDEQNPDRNPDRDPDHGPIACALRGRADSAPYAYIGTMQTHAAAYYSVPERVFSNRLIFERAQAAGRLFGLVHQGRAHHVGTRQDIGLAEWALQAGNARDGARTKP